MVIDLETGLNHLQIDDPKIGGQKHFAWHPNSKYLAIGPFASDGIEMWDVFNRVKLKTFKHAPGELQICFSSTGVRLLSYDAWGNRLLVWNTNSNEVEFSKSGLQLFKLNADETGGFRLFSKQKDFQLVSVVVDSSRIYCTLPHNSLPGMIATTVDFAYSSDGQLLAVSSPYGEVQIFDARSHVELARIASGPAFVHFDKNRSLLTANKLGVARWDLAPVRDNVGVFQMGPPIYISDSIVHTPFEISPDGNTLVISTGKQVEKFALDNSEKSLPLGPPADVRRISISPDGARVATGEWASGKACVWEVASGKLLHTIQDAAFCHVAYSPDGKYLATNSTRVRVWNAKTFELVVELPVDGTSISGVDVAFSPDGRMIAVSDSNSKINFFDPSDGRKIFALTDPNNHLAIRLAFNPDGSQLAVFSSSAVVHIWELEAMNEELQSRNLDLENDMSVGTRVDNGDSGMANIRITLDQSFVEIEAAQQVDLLIKAVEKHDMVSARAAIAKISKLQTQQALACNTLAWILATGPQPLRDSVTAVEFARRAVADESLTQINHAMCLNTLGVALLRDSKIQEATEVLQQSLSVQAERDKPIDLYFLSMCSSRSGEHSKASSYFETAETIAERLRSSMTAEWRNEIAQFAEEAKLLLRDRQDSWHTN